MADNRILAIEIVRLIPSKGMAIVSFREKRRVSSLKGNVLKGGLSRGWKFSSKNYITRYRDPEISRDGIQLRFYRCDKAAKLLLFFPGKEESRDTISAGEKILSNTVRPFFSRGWNGGGSVPLELRPSSSRDLVENGRKKDLLFQRISGKRDPWILSYLVLFMDKILMRVFDFEFCKRKKFVDQIRKDKKLGWEFC